MKMSPGEIIDRYSILKLKLERLPRKDKSGNSTRKIIRKEFKEYEKAIEEFKKEGIKIKSSWVNKLYKINGKIWDLEADIRQGKEGLLGLEEVGKRAIMMREINKERVATKNLINQECGIGYQEIKINHATAKDYLRRKL